MFVLRPFYTPQSIKLPPAAAAFSNRPVCGRCGRCGRPPVMCPLLLREPREVASLGSQTEATCSVPSRLAKPTDVEVVRGFRPWLRRDSLAEEQRVRYCHRHRRASPAGGALVPDCSWLIAVFVGVVGSCDSACAGVVIIQNQREDNRPKISAAKGGEGSWKCPLLLVCLFAGAFPCTFTLERKAPILPKQLARRGQKRRARLFYTYYTDTSLHCCCTPRSTSKEFDFLNMHMFNRKVPQEGVHPPPPV